VPQNRWDAEEMFDSDPEKAAEGKIYCKWGGFLDDFDKFDCDFFTISREEAKLIDPQERLFLESVWSAIEDAAYTRDSLKKSCPKGKSANVGVFVGVTTNTYHLLTPEEWNKGNMVNPGALPWSIANRVSYFFDFQGPSMPVDTACSSSLVAIHLACESLKKRECQVAIAGGVNLYLHPSKYQSFCQSRSLAINGKCRSFGAGDDGFIPGEGVGSMLLKPLEKAIEDQDQIYGVVAASAFDHSGRSNGYSAPNPNAQANLIRDTLQKATAHPESISYIEGHGTGTQLGDSLEIVALNQSFQEHTSKKQYCAIGSVKANIGHSESAAGIAGIAKILLQLKHRQLVPTIHSSEINPNIDFAQSPFYLQHELSDWAYSPLNPRRALVNSFGAGGVNACMVIEEVEQSLVGEKVLFTGPYLIVLSAKTKDRLGESKRRLQEFLNKQQDTDLAELSYTLQTGREAMQDRWAAIVNNKADLIQQLSENCKTGLKPDTDQVRSDQLKEVLAEKNLEKLAALWLAGHTIEWDKLYTTGKPSRISLPTYPFTRERHWVADDLTHRKKQLEEVNNGRLHPLISHNSSTLKEICFSSLLNPEEFYATDHLINDVPVFPGSAYLEMACFTGKLAGENQVRKIRDIVWMQPISFANGSQNVQITLKPNGNGTAYEICSLDENYEKIVHAEGNLFFRNSGNPSPESLNPVEIDDLKAQCPESETSTYFYEMFKNSGFEYGPGFQTIRELYLHDTFALSRLSINGKLKEDFDQFILHPSLIDGALQTVAGLLGKTEKGNAFVPFALDEIEILCPLPRTCYAYVTPSEDKLDIGSEIKKFEILLLNEKGKILVKLKNFYLRSLNAQQSNQPTTGKEDFLMVS
ncbi:MAG: type I polyketide synthase, partial [Proteobacteria bacterium]|nr:type I polyketide synthase [Pseudomonadota bacterium]